MRAPLSRPQTANAPPPADAPRAVSADFLVPREDYAHSRAAAGRFAGSEGEFLVVRLFGAVMLLCCFVFLFFLGSDVQEFWLDALLGVCGLFLLLWGKMLPIWLRARAGNDYDENNRLVEACSVAVCAEGIDVDRPRYRASLPYAMLAGAYEDKNIFLFSLGAGMSFFLPKRCLTGEECSQIREYLSSALQKKFQQEGAQTNG